MGALRDGYQLAIAVDGPRGPFKRAKTGPLEMARRNRIPLVPIAVRATRELTLKRSWDRFACRCRARISRWCTASRSSIRRATRAPMNCKVAPRRFRAKLERLEAQATRIGGKERDERVIRAMQGRGGVCRSGHRAPASTLSVAVPGVSIAYTRYPCHRASSISSASAALLILAIAARAGDAPYYLQKGDTVLFLGDSITAETKYFYKLYFDDIIGKYPELLEGAKPQYDGKGWGTPALTSSTAGSAATSPRASCRGFPR